jgi:hypothetical protein
MILYGASMGEHAALTVYGVDTSEERAVKGTVIKCMEEVAMEKFGVDKWKYSLKVAGVPDDRTFKTSEVVADEQVRAIMKGLGAAAGISVIQVMEAFEEHWSSAYERDDCDAYFARTRKPAEEGVACVEEVGTKPRLAGWKSRFPGGIRIRKARATA